jgi:hypothetical protein
MSSENKLLVNDGLTALIVETLIIQRGEEYYPGSDPDRMDDKIAACKKRVTLLRKLREEYEDEMSKPL